jgi:hypothetical protein
VTLRLLWPRQAIEAPAWLRTMGRRRRQHSNTAKQFCKALPPLLSKPTPSSPTLVPLALKETANSCKSFIAATRLPRRERMIRYAYP